MEESMEQVIFGVIALVFVVFVVKKISKSANFQKRVDQGKALADDARAKLDELTDDK